MHTDIGLPTAVLGVGEEYIHSSAVNTTCDLSSVPGLFAKDLNAFTAVRRSIFRVLIRFNDLQCLIFAFGGRLDPVGAYLQVTTLCRSMICSEPCWRSLVRDFGAALNVLLD